MISPHCFERITASGVLLLKAGDKVNAYAPVLRASDLTAYPKHLLAIFLFKPKMLIV